MLPDEPVPVRLMNTIWADRGGVHDALAGVDNLRSWLAAVGEPVHPPTGVRVGRTDLEAFRSVRDALRRLAALVTEDTRGAAVAEVDVVRAIADLNKAVAGGSSWPQLTLRRGRLEQKSAGTATAAMRSLSSIATQAIELFTGDDKLWACYAPGCVLYFVQDHPRREWCSIACGNRARAARHYRRHRGA